MTKRLERIVVGSNEVKHGSANQILVAKNARVSLVVVYSRRQEEFPPLGETDAVMLNYAGEPDDDEEMRMALKNFLIEIGKHARGAKAFNECYIAHYAGPGGKYVFERKDRFRDLVAERLEMNPLIHGHVENPLLFRVDLGDFGRRLPT